jgi:hypothetical protein
LTNADAYTRPSPGSKLTNNADFTYTSPSYSHITMPASVASAPVHRTATKTTASRTKKAVGAKSTPKPKAPQTNGAVQNGATPSPYGIMASRIANRVAEMAENMTFVERERYALSMNLHS